MKKLILLFCLIFLLNLTGCGASDLVTELMTPVEPSVTEQTEPFTEAPDPLPAETEGTVATEATEPEDTTVVLTSEYYTLTLPEDWAGKCICDIHDRDDGSYTMSVHESQAFLEFGGGTLFTIMMLPTSEDYTIFPDYQLIGALDAPVGTFNLIALFPTDVQFTEATAQTYNQMNECVMDILYTIAPANGAELAMP